MMMEEEGERWRWRVGMGEWRRMIDGVEGRGVEWGGGGGG
jgi:hypothetical protein